MNERVCSMGQLMGWFGYIGFIYIPQRRKAGGGGEGVWSKDY